MPLYIDRRPPNTGLTIQMPGERDCHISVANVFQRSPDEPLTVTLRIDGDREVYVVVRDELLPPTHEEPRRWSPD